MQERHIKINRHARYFVSGNPKNKIKNVWFLIHGYGQLADNFLDRFNFLKSPDTILVAPEGLSKFYIEGFSGKVGASWMTKEDRENEIADYTAYLDKLYKEIMEKVGSSGVKVNVLGFSQGTATTARWLFNRKSKINRLILWAGTLPNLNRERVKLLNSVDLYFVIGDKDRFINEAQLTELSNYFDESEVKYKMIRFDGKHEIQKSVLDSLMSTW